MKYFVLIDFQKDFIDGALGTKEAQALVPKVVDKLNEIKDKEDWAIVTTQDLHFKYEYERSIEGKHIPPHCMTSTNGYEFPSVIKDILKNDEREIPTFTKDTFGCYNFISNARNYCNYHPHNNDIEYFEFAGLCTDICVISNVLALNMAVGQKIPIKVNSALCAGTTSENHQKALDIMRSNLIEII